MKKVIIFGILLAFFGACFAVFAGGAQEGEKDITEEVIQEYKEKDETRQQDWGARIAGEDSGDRDAARFKRDDDYQKASKYEEEPADEPAIFELPKITQEPKEEVSAEPVTEPAAEAEEVKAEAPSVQVRPAGIGANFDPLGISFSGSVSLTRGLGEIISSSDSDSDSDSDSYTTIDYDYTTISARPSLGFFIFPKFALTLTPAFYLNIATANGETISQTIYYGLSAGVTYYFYFGSIFVPAVGANLGFRFYPGNEYQTSYFRITVEPSISAYFFVNDNFAPYLGVYTDLAYLIQEETSSVTLDVAVAVGFSVFLPGVVNARY